MGKAFLSSQWTHVKAPLRNSIQGHDNKIVFLLLDDLRPEDLDLDLKHYLKVCASVRWGSPGFMNKLRFFLPEPAIQTFQRSVTLRTLHHSVTGVSSPSQKLIFITLWTPGRLVSNLPLVLCIST